VSRALGELRNDAPCAEAVKPSTGSADGWSVCRQGAKAAGRAYCPNEPAASIPMRATTNITMINRAAPSVIASTTPNL
jgi:hypothetical protein